MAKRLVLSVILVYVIWAAMDFVIHGVILEPIYGETADLWRPMGEMNMGLMQIVTLVVATCFVLIYTMAGARSVASGLKYGALFGVASGFSMGFGSYAYMPIPITLAWGWFLGVLVEGLVAGAAVGATLKSEAG